MGASYGKSKSSAEKTSGPSRTVPKRKMPRRHVFFFEKKEIEQGTEGTDCGRGVF